MNSQIDEKDDRDFSVELKSNRHLTRLSTSNYSNGGVLIEGTLGKLHHATFIESTILEVEGDCGVLRLNVKKTEITSADEQARNKSGKEEQ